MSLTEISRIAQSVLRRFTNPEGNPLTIRQMSWMYIQRKMYLWFHPRPAIRVPFDFLIKDASPPPRIAVVVHCFYSDLMGEILTHLQYIPFPFRLFVSTDREEKREEINSIMVQRGMRAEDLRVVPNRGRDIAPKYVAFQDVYDGCDYFLHLHSKKSPHTGVFGEKWRQFLLASLVGSTEIVRSNLRLLADSRVGLVFPVPMNDTAPELRWGSSFNASALLARRLGINIQSSFCFDYPDGAMFWGKPAAISSLLDLQLQLDDFPEERGQLDGCLQHAIERLVTNCAVEQGLWGCRVSASPACAQSIENEDALAKAISLCLTAQSEERLKYERTSV
jgi:lipopolysaccharide biosynthesis protein